MNPPETPPLEAREPRVPRRLLEREQQPPLRGPILAHAHEDHVLLGALDREAFRLGAQPIVGDATFLEGDALLRFDLLEAVALLPESLDELRVVPDEHPERTRPGEHLRQRFRREEHAHRSELATPIEGDRPCGERPLRAGESSARFLQIRPERVDPCLRLLHVPAGRVAFADHLGQSAIDFLELFEQGALIGFVGRHLLATVLDPPPQLFELFFAVLGERGPERERDPRDRRDQPTREATAPDGRELAPDHDSLRHPASAVIEPSSPSPAPAPTNAADSLTEKKCSSARPTSSSSPYRSCGRSSS